MEALQTQEVRIGISGWTYAGWRGVFYPDGLAQKRELEYASRALRSIEINGSFYSLQRPSSYAKWYGSTPDDFVFAVKGGRFITHMKKLRDVRIPLANFFASGVLRLREKLGPILWQFPASWAYRPERFEAFFELLPRTFAEAAELAADTSITDPQKRWLQEIDHEGEIRHAVEVRHPSFFSRPFVEQLRDADVALVFSDSPDWPYAEEITSDFVYARLHGAEELYSSGYTDEELDRWADRIRCWGEGEEPEDAERITDLPDASPGGRDVFVYFDNDAKVHAPFDARKLMQRIGQEPADPDL